MHASVFAIRVLTAGTHTLVQRCVHTCGGYCNIWVITAAYRSELMRYHASSVKMACMQACMQLGESGKPVHVRGLFWEAKIYQNSSKNKSRDLMLPKIDRIRRDSSRWFTHAACPAHGHAHGHAQVDRHGNIPATCSTWMSQHYFLFLKLQVVHGCDNDFF